MSDKTNSKTETPDTIQPRSKMSSGLTGLQAVSGLKREQSRNLRKHCTEAETVFWSMVRNRKCGGLKFRRQQVIAGYIADFYCEAAKLVVELDGNVHENKDVRVNDEKKNAAYEERGLYTLRFVNRDVFDRLEFCLEKVKEVAALRMRQCV